MHRYLPSAGLNRFRFNGSASLHLSLLRFENRAKPPEVAPLLRGGGGFCKRKSLERPRPARYGQGKGAP